MKEVQASSLNQGLKKCVLVQYQFSDRVLLVKQKGLFKICIILVHAPVPENTEEKIEKFNSTLDTTKTQKNLKEIVIIPGDPNTYVGKEEIDKENNVSDLVSCDGFGEK